MSAVITNQHFIKWKTDIFCQNYDLCWFFFLLIVIKILMVSVLLVEEAAVVRAPESRAVPWHWDTVSHWAYSTLISTLALHLALFSSSPSPQCWLACLPYTSTTGTENYYYIVDCIGVSVANKHTRYSSSHHPTQFHTTLLSQFFSTRHKF